MRVRSNSQPWAGHPVEGGRGVALGQGQIADHGLDEVVDRAAVSDDRLADVDHFGGLVPDDVYSQQFPGIEVEQHLQETMLSPLTMLWDVAFPVARQVQRGVAYGLADRARSDVDAPDMRFPLDHYGALPELRSLDRSEPR